jgi:hypothetical protein
MTKFSIDELREQNRERFEQREDVSECGDVRGSTTPFGAYAAKAAMPHIESRNERDRCEIEAQEKAFAAERERRRVAEALRRMDTTTPPETVDANVVDVNSFEQRLAELEDELLETVRACNIIRDGHEAELARLTRENSELKAELAALKVEVRQAAVDQGRREVIELPAVPLRSVN